MNRYTISDSRWNEDIAADTLEEAERKADQRLSYTQRTITLMQDGLVVACRRWYPTLEGIEDCENPIQYGSFGYYSDWKEM